MSGEKVSLLVLDGLNWSPAWLGCFKKKNSSLNKPVKHCNILNQPNLFYWSPSLAWWLVLKSLGHFLAGQAGRLAEEQVDQTGRQAQTS